MSTNKIVTFEVLSSKVSSMKETSKIIRYVYSTLDPSSDHKVAQVEKLLKQLKITTKNGDPIRYQHVRNVLTQNVGIKI